MTLSVTSLSSPAVHHKNHLSVLSSPKCEGVIAAHVSFLSPPRCDSWKQVTRHHSVTCFIFQRNKLSIPWGSASRPCLLYSPLCFQGSSPSQSHRSCSVKVDWMNNEGYDDMTCYYCFSPPNTVDSKEITYGRQTPLVHRGYKYVMCLSW